MVVAPGASVLHGLARGCAQTALEVFENRIQRLQTEREHPHRGQLGRNTNRLPIPASQSVCCLATTSTARPISTGGARSKDLLSTKQSAASQTRRLGTASTWPADAEAGEVAHGPCEG